MSFPPRLSFEPCPVPTRGLRAAKLIAVVVDAGPAQVAQLWQNADGFYVEIDGQWYCSPKATGARD